jgi:hypothetical protein
MRRKHIRAPAPQMLSARLQHIVYAVIADPALRRLVLTGCGGAGVTVTTYSNGAALVAALERLAAHAGEPGIHGMVDGIVLAPEGLRPLTPADAEWLLNICNSAAIPVAVIISAALTASQYQRRYAWLEKLRVGERFQVVRASGAAAPTIADEARAVLEKYWTTE